ILTCGVLAVVAVSVRASPHIVGAGVSDTDEILWLRYGKRSQQQTVDARKQRRIRADAQSQRQQNDGGPSFRLKQHARGMPKILKHHHLQAFKTLETENRLTTSTLTMPDISDLPSVTASTA